MSQMTVELLKATLPRALQINATQELADHINNIALDPEVAEEVRNNFLSYTKVLQEGKFKTESYLDAVTYVTHKLMGYSNQDAYIRTFPQRYQTLVAKGMSPKDISAYVAAYHSNKLVNLILEQTVVPSWLLNRDIYQRAINTQFELMTDPDVSAKVRSDAANSILTHLKQPETQKVELDVGLKNAGGIEDLMSSMRQLARQQQELIERGVPARTWHGKGWPRSRWMPSSGRWWPLLPLPLPLPSRVARAKLFQVKPQQQPYRAQRRRAQRVRRPARKGRQVVWVNADQRRRAATRRAASSLRRPLRLPRPQPVAPRRACPCSMPAFSERVHERTGAGHPPAGR